MIEDLAAYNYEYQKANIIRKVIKFNKKNPNDVQLLAWIEEHGNSPSFGSYCKSLILADMQKNTEQTRE